MLWCGAVFAAEGYYEVAAGFEAKLVTHLLDGDGPVPEQIDAAVKQDVIEEARRALVGGGAEEAGKTNLAHTEQTAEMIQPEIVLAAPAHELIGAHKIMTGLLRRPIDLAALNAPDWPGTQSLNQHTHGQTFHHNLIALAALAQLGGHVTRAIAQHLRGDAAEKDGYLMPVFLGNRTSRQQARQDAAVHRETDRFTSLAAGQITARMLHTEVAHHRLAGLDDVRLAHLLLRYGAIQTNHHVVFGMRVGRITHRLRRMKMLKKQLPIRPRPEGAIPIEVRVRLPGIEYLSDRFVLHTKSLPLLCDSAITGVRLAPTAR